MTGCVITGPELGAIEDAAASDETNCVSAAELNGLLNWAVVGGSVEDLASLEVVVGGAESEIGPTIPTLKLVVCTAGALLGGVAAPGVESAGDAETAPLEPVDWAGSTASEIALPAPRVATRPPSVERAEPVFV